jgi:hypothetical protein
MQCDTSLLIQEMKDQVLSGCVIAFTGVIPRNVVPERSDIWQLAESFGALCVHDLTDKVTHLVTATLGTEKMHKALSLPKVQVVWLTWLQTSIALWQHEPERPFLAQSPEERNNVKSGTRPEPTRETGANGDTIMADETSKATDSEEGPIDACGHHVSDDDLVNDAAVLDSAWDDDAQREFDAFLEDGSDDDTMTDGDEEDRKEDSDEE